MIKILSLMLLLTLSNCSLQTSEFLSMVYGNYFIEGGEYDDTLYVNELGTFMYQDQTFTFIEDGEFGYARYKVDNIAYAMVRVDEFKLLVSQVSFDPEYDFSLLHPATYHHIATRKI